MLEIYTERLKIREARISDIDDVMAMERNPAYSDFIWSGSYEEHRDEIESSDCLFLIFEERKTGSFEGFALNFMDRKSNVWELRRIAVRQRGKGYGQETMEAIFDYGFSKTQTNRIWLDVYPHNKAGIDLYEKLGMNKDGILRESYKGKDGYRDQIIYSILRREWKVK